jgi:hypothetical protein
MTLTTRNAFKGIPPKVRSPSRKEKKTVLLKTKEKRKRNLNDDESSSSKKKKKTNMESSESEVEMVDDDDEPEPMPEEIDDDELSAFEVSNIANIHSYGLHSQYSREMALTNINKENILKRSWLKKTGRLICLLSCRTGLESSLE